MGDDDHRSAALQAMADGAVERRLAFGIEVGIGLVEHEQHRIAKERARQREALALAGRQPRAGFAERRVVAVGQAQDEIVDIGELRRLDDLFGLGVFAGSAAMFCATVPSNSCTSCGR